MPIRPSASSRRIVRSERTTGRFCGRRPPMLGALSMGEPDPNPRLRERRRQRRRRRIRIGRVVTFEDPVLSARRPELALRSSDGTPWHSSAGLGWTNPYDRRVWRYNVDVAAGAARAGFDEIQFDYVRFPSDGDLSAIRYPGAHPQPMKKTIAAFLRYAVSRLHPLGVRVSADVFGLSATHDLGIGQYPSKLGKVVDAIYPMTYPSHYRPGEYNLPNPDDAPGTTVMNSLRDF